MPRKSPEKIRQEIEVTLRRDPVFKHLTNEEFWEVSMIAARSMVRASLREVDERMRFDRLMGCEAID